MARVGGLVGCALALLLLGVFSDEVFAFTQRMLAGWVGRGATAQSAINPMLMRRPWYVMLPYGLIYCAVGVLTVHLYFLSLARTRVAVLCYAVAFGLIAALMVVGKLGGDIRLCYKLARRLIELVVSPMPVVLLIPTLTFFTHRPPNRR